MPQKKHIKKTTIELSQEQYFFLKERAIELEKQNKGSSTVSVVSIIRDLIDKYMANSGKKVNGKRGGA